MSGNKMIPVEGSFAEWRKDPDYVKAYNALEDEFSLAAEMIRARASARLKQEQLRTAHEHDAGGDRTARKRPGQAVDAHARTARRRDRDEAADFIRAHAGAITLPLATPAHAALKETYAVDAITRMVFRYRYGRGLHKISSQATSSLFSC